ncbi:MAG: hypothetical protein L0Z70_12345 [Chloroflexi bacterium]|nr:hypothetical protein [Chloroflexota bacterium]
MNLSGLHILLTLQCTFECDHCFVFGSPRQNGVFDLPRLREVLRQAQVTPHVRSIYFEGGEPFLYYATLLGAARMAAEMGFQVGAVSNGYWALSPEDALECLRPFAGLLQDLSVSSDLFHYDEKISAQSRWAGQAASQLDISCGVITIAQPGCAAPSASGQLPEDESAVMYRGRAAEKLAHKADMRPWETFTACPHEDLRDPGRVHLDPWGNLHLCQGIVMGNLFHTPLAELCASYRPEEHPIAAPLLAGGPAELARRCSFSPAPAYADACHLCFNARQALRPRFPDLLTPAAMYGS